jgi:hypothetical protein
LLWLSAPYIPRVLGVLWYLKFICGPYVCRLSCVLPCVGLACFCLFCRKTLLCVNYRKNSTKMLCSLPSIKTPRRMITLTWITTCYNHVYKRSKLWLTFMPKFSPEYQGKRSYTLQDRLQLEQEHQLDQEDEGYTNMF